MKIVSMMVACLAAIASSAIASPAHSPPNAATAPPVQPFVMLPTVWAINPDAPSPAAEMFERLLMLREDEYAKAQILLEREKTKLAEFSKAIIAPGLKPNESPKFTNKGVWAFRSKGDKDAAVGVCASEISTLTTQIKRVSAPDYLPDIGVLGLSEIEASATYSVDPAFVNEDTLEQRIDRSTLKHNLKSGWVGYVPAMSFELREGKFAIVDVIASVRAVWNPPPGALGPQVRGTSNPGAIPSMQGGSRIVPVMTLDMPIEFGVAVSSDLIPIDTIVGHQIDTQGILFYAAAENGRIVLNRFGKLTDHIHRVQPR